MLLKNSEFQSLQKGTKINVHLLPLTQSCVCFKKTINANLHVCSLPQNMVLKSPTVGVMSQFCRHGLQLIDRPLLMNQME